MLLMGGCAVGCVVDVVLCLRCLFVVVVRVFVAVVDVVVVACFTYVGCCCRCC